MNHYQKQKGVVLIVSLVLLVLVTLISVSSMKNTILEEKMAGNFKDRNSAFQAAEAALRDGENYLFITTILPLFNASTVGLYQPTSAGEARWDVVTWTDSTQVRTYSSSLADIKTAPKYIIEELPPVPVEGSSLEAGVAQENKYYRITSQATGNTDQAKVWLQSTYKR